VSNNNNISYFSCIVDHESVGQRLNKMLKNDESGNMSQINCVIDSGVLTDYISVSDKTGVCHN